MLENLQLFIDSDGTIVSGDSMGIVKFWDSKTCTQLQSFQGHAADVLCLTVGPVSFACHQYTMSRILNGSN